MILGGGSSSFIRRIVDRCRAFVDLTPIIETGCKTAKLLEVPKHRPNLGRQSRSEATASTEAAGLYNR
jgi:hypothetical protein